jgi:radical SAM protein (TIGR01212 family)
VAETSRSEPFLKYSEWLRSRYGEKTYRVSVDAGFTCPVREVGQPCAYCDAGGSRAPYLGDRRSIEEQIARGVAFLSRRYKATRFLLYFQAFSNTHASVARLRDIYDHALSQASFVGLIVGTRPDCIDEPRVELLAEYAKRGFDVWVELGLQSANDQTLLRIRRGHTREQFDEAVRLLDSAGINVAAHVILGLPGEGEREAVQTARHLSGLPVAGVKFHNLVVVKGTSLYDEYERGRFEPPHRGDYERLLVAALEHLRRDIVVMRLTCDPPPGAEYAPTDLPQKAELYDGLGRFFSERGTHQGIYWRRHADQG